MGALAFGPEEDPATTDRPGSYVSVVRGSEMDVVVWMQLVLYSSPESDHFFVRLSVENRTGSELGVDLRSYSHVVRPIQWVGSDDRSLSVINIRTPEPPVADSGFVASVIRSYAKGDLAVLPADGFLHYFVDFNAGSASDLQGLDTAYLHMALGGELTVTDGETVEVLSLPEGFRFFRMALPIEWDEMYGCRTVAGDEFSGSIAVYL